MKTFFKFLTIIILAITSYIYFIIRPKPTMITPYTYTFSYNYSNSTQINEIQNSQILILGDRQGKNLDAFLPELTKEVSVNLRKPIKIFNWSSDGDGLHRSLEKLKSLKKIPPLVVVYGTSQEFYEKKFNINDHKTIFSNFKKYHNTKILTAIMSFPILSKFIYKSLKYYNLPESPVENTKQYRAAAKQMQMSLTYKFFEHELKDLTQKVLENESSLVLITSPINLGAPPRTTCSNALTKTIQIQTNDIKKIIKKEQYKIAYNKLKELSNVTVGNAQIFYMLGVASKNMGRITESKKYFQKSAAFDCSTWRSNIVFNNIIRKSSVENGSILLDFDYLINQDFGKNHLFLDEVIPQDLYLKSMLKT
ncbi:MAG: hypothetical protein HOJ35_10050, partial [Bdellovibrionales bacterium]|nr:hypothetical protein [Bdellovibrionales bacterium]